MDKGFIVPTGYIIKEYLDENNISQKELSNRLGMSEKHISNLLNGKSRLTEEMALKLENILPDVSASYWLNYETKYRLQLAREVDESALLNIDLSDIANRFKFNEVFSGLNWDVTRQAKEMLKLLGISSFNNFNAAYMNKRVSFMEDGGDPEAIIVWLKLCESEILIQNDDLSDVSYQPDNLTEHLSLFRDISLNSSLSSITDSCKTLCNDLGIYLVLCKAISNCKVRGALTTYKDHPAIFLSGRYKTHDHIWFAFMHELGHLIMHYTKDKTIISYDTEPSQETDSKEREANMFACDIFINKQAFIEFTIKSDFSEKAIRTFASNQKIRPGIVVGRLHREQLLDRSKLNFLKDPIEI